MASNNIGMTEVPVLECTALERRFGGLTALTSASLTVKRAEIFGIVGPNGSGKTTLTNVISGFYPPNKGTVVLRGRDITGLPPYKIARLGLARTFQNLALFNGLTVLDNILLGRHTHMKTGVIRTALYNNFFGHAEEVENREIVEEVIHFMQLEGVRSQLVDALPIGVKKRVELARALVAMPDLLVLDEPMAGMNQEEKEYMSRFILDAREARGTSIVIIEHHMDIILGICDRVMVLSYGETLGMGDPKAVLSDPKVVTAYLGSSNV